MKAILILCLAAPAWLSAAQAVKRYVTLDGTLLLTKPAAFSKNLGKLKKGDTVMAEKGPNGYFKVKVQTGSLAAKSGYLSSRALQDKKPKIGVMATKGRDASSEEVAAATKGFNKQVESEHRKKNSKLDYETLDLLEERTEVQNPREALEGFRKEGKLGEFSEAGNE